MFSSLFTAIPIPLITGQHYLSALIVIYLLKNNELKINTQKKLSNGERFST
jgi:hypothetical protein